MIQDVDKICVSPKFTRDDAIKQEATYKERYFMYHEHTLIQFNHENDTQERGILQIKYARLKKTKITDKNKKKLYGFVLMMKGRSLQFFMEDEEL